MAKEDIKKYSLDEIKAMRRRGEDQTKPNAQQFSVDEDFWKNIEIVSPAAKKPVSLRIEEEVFEWFKKQGPGHIIRMQAVLKKYYEAHQTSS